MGNQCCQATNNVEFESIAQQAFLSDYVESQWPDDNDLQSLLKLSNIYKKQIGKSPLKHKVYNRWFWGNWTDGRPIGDGILYNVIAKDTVYYQGEFSGQPSGQGRVVFNGGEWEYVGIVKNAKADGQGRLVNKKQEFLFQGEWKQSKPYKGKLTLQSTSEPQSRQKQIEGNIIVEIDLSSGQKPSIIYYPDGKKYVGEIHKFRFVPDGQGTLYFPNKSVYKGEWFQGQMHGQGKFQWADGSRYDGQYQYGKKCGIGKFIYASGNQYQGHWLNGKQQGQGILYDRNRNQLKKGLWKNGQFVQK